MSYSNGKLDQMTLINVNEGDVKQWRADKYVSIIGGDPYEIASKIVLQDWSYTDDAVIAVIEPEYKKPERITSGEIHGKLAAYDIGHKHLIVELPDIGTAGTWSSFEINDQSYKYITMKLTWPYKILDYDLQLYDTQLGQVDNAMKDFKEHLADGTNEIVGSFIHNYKKWRVSVTAVPKKGIITDEESSTSLLETVFSNIENTMKRQGEVDITLYPGTTIKLPETPIGCRNINLKLKWKDPNVKLGFTVIDPAGTEICSSLSLEEIISTNIENKQESSMNIDLLGETRENENYTVCIFSLNDLFSSIDFTLDYSWEQKFSEKEVECLSSASNGAVLASKLNAPLLYVSPSELPESTEEVLYKLGVEKIYLIDIGNNLKKDVEEEIFQIADIIEYDTAREVYNAIKKDVDGNDVVFTTIDPWTYWYVKELKRAGEFPGALFIGPAAYCAAHHETPTVIVDLHPRLSQAVTYHTHFWGSPYYNQHIDIPNSGSMALSSRQVYDFLEDYNLGALEEGDASAQVQETIITVAGQYDIGIPWDRSFTGAALNGRFMFSPVDTAYSIARNIFYPALIFENPATTTNKLWNGSESKVSYLPGARLKEPRGINLVITKPSKEEEFQYPVLSTFADFIHKFNEEASKHWNFKYERADGIIPGEQFSKDTIDDGVVQGKSGAYYPDLHETYVIPFYATKAGYDNVYSSNFEKSVENLNRGVVMWMLLAHGGHTGSGVISFWNPDSPYVYEENPWRVYETPFVYPGNLRELVRWLIYLVQGEKTSKLTEGLIPFHLFGHIGSTQNPDVLHINPQLRLINSFLRDINFPFDFWGATGVIFYRDRILHPLQTIKQNLPFARFYKGDGKVIISPRSGGEYVKDWRNGLEFDDALDNLHSCGVNAISCLPAGTYLHLTWVRHGMVYQIIDPWVTTDWSAVWEQMIIKRLAMGDTIGQAYERGMRATGPEYTVGQFWWDRFQNVELFGDPDLRVFVPSTEYSDNNYWTEEETQPIKYDEELNLAGHMPYGATSYPHEKEPDAEIPLWAIILIAVILVLILVAVAAHNKKKK